MPDYDGTGPLKRGRVIGRGMGTCRHSADGCMLRKKENGRPDRDGKAPE